MRKIVIIILFIFCGFFSKAQLAPVGTIFSPNASTSSYKVGWIKADSAIITATRDTNFIARYPGTIIYWPHVGVDSSCWVANGATTGQKWNRVVTLPNGSGGGLVIAITGNSPVIITGTSTNPIISVDTTIILATKAYVNNQLGSMGTVKMANAPLFINGMGAIVNADTGRGNAQLVTGGDLKQVTDSSANLNYFTRDIANLGVSGTISSKNGNDTLAMKVFTGLIANLGGLVISADATVAGNAILGNVVSILGPCSTCYSVVWSPTNDRFYTNSIVAGGGTVQSIVLSVTNGITLATNSSTTNYTATFGLGAITPISVNATGFLQGSTLVLAALAGQAYKQGLLQYDTDNESLTFNNNDANVSLQIGQEEWIRVKNVTGSSIANGSVVYLNGSNGAMPTIALAQSNASSTTIGIGLATETIANNAIGYVTIFGVVHGLNTAAFTAGQTVFISSSVAGGLTATAPSAPNYRYRVGIVAVADAVTGTIHVTPSTAALGNGIGDQLFGMNSAGTNQEVKTIAAGANISVTNTAGLITISASAGSAGLTNVTLNGTNGLTISSAIIGSTYTATINANSLTPALLSVTSGFTSTATVSTLGVANMSTTTITGLATVTTVSMTGKISALNISATNITAALFSGAGTGLTGTAASLTAGAATTLATARTIALSSPDFTSTPTSFNGSANIAIPFTLTNINNSPATVNGLATTANGRVVSYSPLTATAQFQAFSGGGGGISTIGGITAFTITTTNNVVVGNSLMTPDAQFTSNSPLLTNASADQYYKSLTAAGTSTGRRGTWWGDGATTDILSYMGGNTVRGSITEGINVLTTRLSGGSGTFIAHWYDASKGNMFGMDAGASLNTSYFPFAIKGGLTFTATAGSFPTASIGRSATSGLGIVGIAGSSYDFVIASPTGPNIMMVPTNALGVTFASTVTALGFVSSSDGRMKDVKWRIKSKDGIDMVAYTWKKEFKKDNGLHFGYIAQEVEKQGLPIVSFIKDTLMKNGQSRVLNYTETLVYKIAKLEERTTKEISDLQKENKELKDRLNKIEVLIKSKLK